MNKLERMTTLEANKWMKYWSALCGDILARRGTEGVNPLIPRQEYELAAGVQTFFSHPAIHEFVADRIGMEGLRELGRMGRRAFGVKINSDCDITCLQFIPLAVGRAALINAGLIKPDEYTENVITLLSFWKAVTEGWRQDGELSNQAAGYTCRILDEDVVRKLDKEVEPLNDETRSLLGQFNAIVQLQAFMNSYDCRLGMEALGPYDLGDRVIMV